MNKAKFRPSLVIGLGGSGQWVLSLTKRNVLEMGESDSVRFLAIDTSEKDTSPYSMGEELDSGEFYQLRPRNLFAQSRDVEQGTDPEIAVWYPAKQLLSIFPPAAFELGTGSGTVRPIGRLGLLSELQSRSGGLFPLLSSRLQAIASNKTSSFNVILVASLDGATGSSMYVDVVALIRHLATRVGLLPIVYGFLFLPEDKIFGGGGNKAMTIAAWRELNRMMVIQPSMPVQFHFEKNEPPFNLTVPLFDSCYLLPRTETAKTIRDQYAMTSDVITILMDRIGGEQISEYQLNLSHAGRSSGSSRIYNQLNAISYKLWSHTSQNLLVTNWLWQQFRRFAIPPQQQNNQHLMRDRYWDQFLSDQNSAFISAIVLIGDQNKNPKDRINLNSEFLDHAFLSKPEQIREAEWHHILDDANYRLRGFIDRSEHEPDGLRDWFILYFGEFNSDREGNNGVLDETFARLNEIRIRVFTINLYKFILTTLNDQNMGEENGRLFIVLDILKRFINALDSIHRDLDNQTRNQKREAIDLAYYAWDFGHELAQQPNKGLSRLFGNNKRRQFEKVVLDATQHSYAVAVLHAIIDASRTMTRIVEEIISELRDWQLFFDKAFQSLESRFQDVTRSLVAQNSTSTTVILSEKWQTQLGQLPDNFEDIFKNDDIEIKVNDALALPLQIKPVFTLVVGKQEISLKNNPIEVERALTKSVTPQIPEPNILSVLKKQYNNEIDAVTDLIRKIERVNLPLHGSTETTNWICLPPDTDMLIKEAALSEVQIRPDFDLITLSHNAICTAIKTSHSLSSSDFNVWDSYLSNYYQEILGQERVLVTPHIFPNENNAVLWERQLWQKMQTPPRLLHPRLVQVMEDNTRFVLFSRSLLSELITYDPSFGFVLALPDQTVRIQLSDTSQYQRSAISFEELLFAAYAFVSIGTDIRRGGERNRINYQEISQFLDELTKSNLEWLHELANNRYEKGILREVLQDTEEDTGLRQDFLDVFELIIQDWLQVAQRQFTLELTKPRRSIKRLENFYVAGPPLTPKSGKLFVGRQQVFRNIEEAWRNPLQKQAVVLHGQRRLGKTSILYHLSERLGQSFIPVLLDLQGMAVEITSEETLWSAIAQRIRRTFKDDPIISQDINDIEVRSAATMSVFLNRLEDSLGEDRWLILSFDEFEKLEEKLKDGTVPNNFLDYLRSLIQHRQQILVLLAGHHTLQERMGEYWGPLMGVARSEHLTFLSESESRDLVTDPWDGFQLRYKPEAVDRLVTACGGQPLLLQLACSGVIKLINRRLSVEPEISPIASLKDILDVLHEIAADSDKSSFYFDAVWDWLTEDERNLSTKLALLADKTKGSHGWVEKSRFSDDEQQITERLVIRDIIEKQEGKYRFRVELLRWWINNRNQ